MDKLIYRKQNVVSINPTGAVNADFFLEIGFKKERKLCRIHSQTVHIGRRHGDGIEDDTFGHDTFQVILPLVTVLSHPLSDDVGERIVVRAGRIIECRC